MARAAMTLFLVMLTSIASWATGGTLAGSGTSSDPYVIVDADDWGTFVNWINNSNSTYASKYYKLGADITISSMAGTKSGSSTLIPFKGTFDGDGHTITLNDLTSDNEFCAPFRYVDGATFKRIHTTGTVIAGSDKSKDKYRTGLVGDCRGTTTITNCWSSVAITSEINEDGTHGGFVGVVNGGTLTITNCLFDGSITGTNTWANAGFVGWTGGYTTNITNCLMLGTINDNPKNGATFMRGNEKNSVVNSADNIKVNNSYYNEAHGTVQGTAIGSMTNAQLLTALGNNWEISGGKLVPVMSTNNLSLATVSGLTTPYYIWTGSPIAVNYTVTDAEGKVLTEGTDYTASFSPATVQEVGEYTLTITGKGSYTGTKIVTFEVRRTLYGSGTAADPYLIGSDIDWKTFANWINNENTTYRNKYYKLTADINVTTTVGTSEDNSFRGTFDGDGHTMTLDLTSEGDYWAPFRYGYNGVTLKRIHVAGTINTSHRYAAGLVGYQKYDLNIINCWNSVTINSSTNENYPDHGGFIGYVYGTTNLTNCRFDGKLLGPDSKACGGFVGYQSSGYTINVTNCLYAPTEVTVSTENNSSTFVRISGTTNITNSYYTETLGIEQGTAVGSMTNAELQQALGKGWDIINNKVVPVQDIKNLTAGSIVCNTFFPYTGSEITVTPTVKDMDGNTIAAENYSVSFSPSPVQVQGNYTMTVNGNANGYSGTLTHQFEVANYIAGTGTKDDPFLIGSTDDWNTLAASVAGGITYSGKYVKLTNDITITTMVGIRDGFPFQGTFDGDNHTITANIVSTATGDDMNEQGVAPFHYLKSAKIKNLTVAGSITSASKYAAGLAGWAHNYTEFNDCVVTATITTSADYAGGFVGNMDVNSNGYYLYFTNCVFAGTINNTSSDANRRAGGFIGYGGGYSYFTNCLENGTYTNLTLMNPRNSYNYFYNDNVTSLYYINKIGNTDKYIADGYGCHQVTKTAPTEDIYLAKALHGYDFYQPVLITDMYETYAYNNGEEIILNYALKIDSKTLTKDTDYEVVLSSTPAAIGNYTITFTAKADNKARYAGAAVRSFRVMEGESLDGYVFATEGEGDDKVYLINDESDLKRLAAYVNSGHNAQGKTFKQNADITLAAAHTTIGGYIDGNYRYFYGIFDGNNKSITNLTINQPDFNYQGLFGYTSSAVIKNVNLVNCNITGKSYTGGIAGNSSGTIQNCHVSGTIAATVADATYHGGIVGHATGTTITDCTMTGAVSTSVSNDYYGGIVGRAGWDVIFTSCENAAAISGDGEKHGGIVGDDDASSNRYNLCLNTGTVAGTKYVGAIAGEYSWTTNYTNCYYASPCTANALGYSSGASDYSGRAERGYIVTAGDHINNIVAAETGVVTSVLSGKKYYKKGNWTLTLTPDLTDVTFVTYACEGGTLTNLETVDGDHVLTITDKDVTISAVVSSNSGIDMSTVNVAPIADKRWKGSDPVIPALTVTNGTTPLVLGTDYLVEGTNNTAIGTATLTLTGINGYKGTTTKTFNIVDLPLLDAEKSNSSENPYLIATEEDLEALASIVNTDARRNGYYKQTADITLTEEHTAIGTNNSSFNGRYDGDNKTISGLYINKPDAYYQGLFGYINSVYDDAVKNVVIVDCDITAKSYVGGICGYLSYSNIRNCSVSGAIKAADGVEANYHGGIVGYLDYYKISNCINTASVTGNGNYNGGIAGEMWRSTAENCFNAGIVEGTSYVGSIVGYNYSGQFTNNYHTTATTGGVGANSATGTDQTGAEVVAKISAADGVTLTLPTEPNYVWNAENLYKSGTKVTLNYAVPDGKVFDHYTVNSGEISNAGIIDGEHTLTGFSEDVVITGSYADNIIDLATAGAVIADIDNLTYNGSVQHPVPVVTLDTETLEENNQYTVSYSDGCTNAGTYTVTVTGSGRYSGSVSKNFTIDPFNVENCEIKMENQLYTGSEIELNPTVKRDGTLLVKGADKDFVITTVPAEVLAVGDYTMTITGVGNYTGTKDFDFQVIKRLKIGSGTSTSSVIPFNNWDNYALTQQIYTADELGNQAGKITSIDLRETSTKDCKRTMDIYLVNTSKSSFENETDWIKVTEADKVFSGQVEFPEDDWATVTFDTPFMYDGTSNLAIIFDVTRISNAGDTYGSGRTFLVYEGGTNQTLYNWSDSQNLDPQSDITANGSLSSTKSQVRLVVDPHEKIEMNAHGIMTYASDNALDFSNVSGLRAHYASNFELTEGHNGVLTMTKAEEVPASEGLMLKGTANETFYVPIIETASPLASNLMVGLTTATSVDPVAGDYTNFILSKQNDAIAWYKLANTYTLRANSAYLHLLTADVFGARAITMDFGDGEATSIDQITDDAADGDWYTIDGLKLDKKPTKKGVYVTNGHKVVVK